MKLIYIAGPYRSPTEYGVHCNIRNAEHYAATVWKLGAAAVCPHKNSAYMAGVVDDEVFLEGDLVLMKKCDAVFMMPNWPESEGAIAEHDVAVELGMPVLLSLEEVRDFVEEPDIAVV